MCVKFAFHVHRQCPTTHGTRRSCVEDGNVAAKVRTLLITPNAVQAVKPPSSPLPSSVVQGPRRGSLVGILALGICIVVLNEAPVAVVVVVVMRCGHAAHAVGTPRHVGIALGGLLRNRVAGVDPVGVDVDGRAEVVDVGLERLAAHLALQVADARLLLDGDADGIFVVAEEALEGRGQLLLLRRASVAGRW